MIKIPDYRFKGYTEPWVQKKLGGVVERITRKNKNLESNLPLTISAQYGLIDQETFFNKKVASKDVSGYYLLKKGEFAYNKSYSSDYPWGAVKRLDNYEMGVLSTLYIVFRPNFIDSDFLAVYYDSPKWYKEVSMRAAEGARNHGLLNISPQDFFDTVLIFPVNQSEQTAIGSFFQDIDQLISLQQHKLEVLKEQKKTYLKLLFPAKGQTKPALRFAGFEDDWKEVKLGEVLKKNNKKNRDLAINNVESVSNKLGFVKQTEQFEDYSVASADLSNYYVISEKQFAYNPSRINVGSIAYKKEGDTLSVVSPLYISFSTVENIDDSYLWYWFKTSLFDSQRAIYSEGGVRDTLSFNQLSDIELISPSLPEQEAIGSFFQDLDKAIAKQEEKVNQLKESKQTLLRKMFI